MKKILGTCSTPGQHWVGDGFPVRSLFSYNSQRRLEPADFLPNARTTRITPGEKSHERMIPPPAQQFMSKRAGSTVVESKGSHAVYVSQPGAVATLVEKAARESESISGDRRVNVK